MWFSPKKKGEKVCRVPRLIKQRREKNKKSKNKKKENHAKHEENSPERENSYREEKKKTILIMPFNMPSKCTNQIPNWYN